MGERRILQEGMPVRNSERKFKNHMPKTEATATHSTGMASGRAVGQTLFPPRMYWIMFYSSGALTPLATPLLNK